MRVALLGVAVEMLDSMHGVDEFLLRSHLHLLVDMVAVRVDRALGQEQLLLDVRGAFSGGEQLEYFTLALRKTVLLGKRLACEEKCLLAA